MSRKGWTESIQENKIPGDERVHVQGLLRLCRDKVSKEGRKTHIHLLDKTTA